jgi:hypothetical protein
MDARLPAEAALNAADVEAWVSRCTRRLMDLNPDSPLDGMDWVDIAGDLYESLARVPPEWAAATYVALAGD